MIANGHEIASDEASTALSPEAARIEALIARHGLNRLELSAYQIEQLRRLFSSAE